MNRIIFGVFFLCISSCNTLEKDLPIFTEINKNWEFKAVESLDWKTASVPGNVFADLLAHAIIEKPFKKNNEEKVRWVSKKNWEYKTTFTLSDALLKKENIELIFEGLDTYAKIYINGKYQLNTDNACRKYSISLKELPMQHSNELRIVFKNTASFENAAKLNSKYKLPKGNRIYTRKAQFQYDWDWGTNLNTSGISKSIFLHAWDDLKFESIYIRQKEITTEKAIVSAEITIESSFDKNINLFTKINREVISSNIALKKGKHTYKIPIEITNPKLWWTHNLGTPYLYHFKFQLIANGKVKDEKLIKKGIRTIKLITKKDSIGESFYFELNGKAVYVKGVNYIPQHSFQNKVTNKQYEKLLSDAVTSNKNLLRVMGGGIYENNIFYELCDAKGILVWQDFMFACAMYPRDNEFLANVKKEAERQVKRLRNHTSIALWYGNNESAEGWRLQNNSVEKEKKEIWDDYLAVFDSILPNVVAEFSETNYWETSPKYKNENPKDKTAEAAHDL
jgi:beta-mannosidase